MNEQLSYLIKENEKLIYKITHFFTNYESKEDLFQVGCIGLIKAYQNYKEGYNTKFTTYAYPYILGEIKKYVREDKGIKVSRDITKLNLKIEKANVLDISENKSPIYYLAKSIELLDKADAVVFMPGWQQYRGCRIEFQVAKDYGIFLKESYLIPYFGPTEEGMIKNILKSDNRANFKKYLL